MFMCCFCVSFTNYNNNYVLACSIVKKIISTCNLYVIILLKYQQ